MIPRDEASAARTAHKVRTAATVLLLALVAISPWPFGSANPSGQFVLALGLFVLIALWAAHAILTQRFEFRTDAVSVCLLGLVFVTAAQLVPIPESIARVLSPTAVEWRHALIPEVSELLPGESPASVPRRGEWMCLSLAPAASEDLLVQFLALYLIYTAARNFAVDGRSLTRLAWIGFAVGVGLAVLAIAQYLSGERERIYWRYPAGAQVFGPFVNKNHFSFQLHLFVGLSAGLFLRTARRDGLSSPLSAGLLGGLALMIAAVGFSQSRGGALALVGATILSVAVARMNRTGDSPPSARIGMALVGGVVIIVVALVAWLGWGTMLDRFASLWQGKADNRSQIWRNAWPLVTKFPLVGLGGGGYSVAEIATRTSYEGSFISVSAHNEYLEALIEGGIVRFALTVALAIAVVWNAARRYWRTRDPLVLGCLFGLCAVAIHSIGEFGIHMPSIALTAVIVAACAARRRRENAQLSAETELVPAITTRSGTITAGIVLLFAALLVVLDHWRLYRVDRLRSYASLAVQPHDAARFLEAAARIRPNDPNVWEELASAHLQAAAEEGQSALAGLVGFAELGNPSDILPGSDPDHHVTDALKAARAGRNAQPLIAGFHLRLGTFANRFAQCEPARVHFDRAIRVGSSLPDVWFIAGQAAADGGDWPRALADWRESLARSPRRLNAIARAAFGRVAPAVLREKALPDDPAAWFAVTPILFAEDDVHKRTEWLRAIDNRCRRAEPETVPGFAAWGSALEQLSDPAGAIRAWRRGVERFPENVPLHDRLAIRLETEELYEEAQPVLEWLAAREPDNGTYRERLAAAKHALRLKADINGR